MEFSSVYLLQMLLNTTHELLQFVNMFNLHVCLLPVVNFDSSLLQILCMAVYRNIFLASGCLSKIFFEVHDGWLLCSLLPESNCDCC
jgi:hypothetical protein